jgi:hypothetical protein
MAEQDDAPKRFTGIEQKGGERFSIPYGSLKPNSPAPVAQTPSQPPAPQQTPPPAPSSTGKK